MALSNDLVSQFVKATQDKPQVTKETTSYGKIVKQGDVTYVQLDGSDLLTPITSTTVVKDEDRVIVNIKDHTATVTGNLTSPSASDKDVKEIGSQITEFEIIMADKVTTQDLEAINAYIENLVAVTGKYEELSAITAEIETLQAKYATMEHISAIDAQIINAEIQSLKGKLAQFTSISTEDLTAINAELDNLVAYNASFTYVSAEQLEAIYAKIDTLDVESLKAMFANIDFSNIGEAAIEKLFTDSGIIRDLIMKDGNVTGELVGVTIKGDLIEGNTIKADKLIIKGEDGIYYKLNVDSLGEEYVSTDEKFQNGLDGSVLIAQSVTADKVTVSDLVAFDATIGGYNITDSSIYSGAKASVENTTRGIYLGSDGQMAIGDETNYLRYYRDEDGGYKLDLRFGGLTIDEKVNDLEGRMDNALNEAVSVLDESVNSLNDAVTDISTSLDTKVDATQVDEAVKAGLEQGVDKVVTSVGFSFDDAGLLISKSGSPMSTVIDEDGMDVKYNDEERLIANSDGVDAYNLHARTFLILGDNSRFENYIKGTSTKQTGCFWIGP